MLLQPKESELHCTGLAALSLKPMNLLVVLEILSVNMIHINLHTVWISVTLPCVVKWVEGVPSPYSCRVTLIRLITRMPTMSTQHKAMKGYRCLPALSRLSIPMASLCYWIGLFVPRR